MGRSSFRTWLWRIVVNRARSRARREARCIPFSALPPDALPDAAIGGLWQSVDPGPERRWLERRLQHRIDAAIAALPPQQRAVITLRDVEGRSAAEASRVLGVSAANQRVLLHRARRTVRAALQAVQIGPESLRTRASPGPM